jgi:hypothetical protein
MRPEMIHIKNWNQKRNRCEVGTTNIPSSSVYTTDTAQRLILRNARGLGYVFDEARARDPRL